MTGAKLKEANELIRRLHEQHPSETEEQLLSRFSRTLDADEEMRRAVCRDVFNDWMREIDHERKGRDH